MRSRRDTRTRVARRARARGGASSHAPRLPPRRYIKVPIQVMDVTIGAMEWLGQYFDALKDPTEFAKIGRYYAVEDMVGPSYGTTTLKTFFEDVAENGLEGQELGDQAVFNIDGAATK